MTDIKCSRDLTGDTGGLDSSISEKSFLSDKYISVKVYFFVGPSTQCSAVQRVRLNKVDVVMLYYVMSELRALSHVIYVSVRDMYVQMAFSLFLRMCIILNSRY